MPDSFPLYIVDTSSFVRMAEFYPIPRVGPYWRDVDSLIKNGRLKTVPEVFIELEKRDPHLKAWLGERRKKIELKPSDFRERMAQDILRHFPELVNVRTDKDPADPYVVAAVLEKFEEMQVGLPLNSTIKHYPYLVQEESRKREKKKIPHVCDEYDVDFISITQFWELEDWVHE